MMIPITAILAWSNDNQGVLAIALFAATILLGWVSGIWAALRRKPKLRVRLIMGPSFVCTYGTGATFNGYDVHRTAVALYLHIANVGSAATDIENVEVGYHWAVTPFSRMWWKYGIGTFWLQQQTVALEDFQVAIGDSIKFYPFLLQRSAVSQSPAATFLEAGQSTNGVVYFEQSDSWGGMFPVSIAGRVSLKIRVIDTFGRSHYRKARVARVGLNEARQYNPSFARTLHSLHGGDEPKDLPLDANGNLLPPTVNS